MRAVTMYRALVKASKGKPLTVERQLTMQWLRAEARVEREVAKRQRIRAHLDGMRQLFEGRAA